MTDLVTVGRVMKCCLVRYCRLEKAQGTDQDVPGDRDPETGDPV